MFTAGICSSEIPNYKRRNVITETNGFYGFRYKGKFEVNQQYEQTIALGDNRACFLAKRAGKWGLIDIYNRPIIPFQFTDVKTDCSSTSRPNRTTFLDSIYIYGSGTILPRHKFSFNNQYAKYSDITPPILLVQEQEPESGEFHWHFIDFKGNPISSGRYEYATIFQKINGKSHDDYIYLAHVKSNGLWGAIDLYGNEVVPLKHRQMINGKNKYVKKLLKRNQPAKEEARISELESMVPLPVPYGMSWKADSIENVRIEKTGGKQIKVRKKNKKGKYYTTNKYTPVSYKIYVNDTLAIDEAFDEIAPQQKNMIRVKKDGKWGIYKIGSGMFVPCECSSIEPFDACGIAKCQLTPDIEMEVSAYGAHTSLGPDIEDIFYRANETYSKNRDIEATGPIFEELLEALNFYDDQRLRLEYQSQQMVQYFNNRREREDPIYGQMMADLREQKRIEEENAKLAEEQKRQAKKSGGGFWGLLGELASVAGDVIDTTGSITGNSSTSDVGSSLSYLGKSVTAVAQGKEMPEVPERSNPVAQNSSIPEEGVTADTYGQSSDLQSKINVLDNQITENREEAARLVKEREKAYNKYERDMYYGSKKTPSRDITKNNPYRTARKRAQNLRNNSIGNSNRLSAIDSKIDRLNNEWERLLTERSRLTKELNASIESPDETHDNSSSKAKKGRSKEFYQRQYDSYASEAKMIYTSLTGTGYSVKKNGKDLEGSASGGRGVVNFSLLKDKLIKSQQGMRRIRQEASRKGHTLTKSEYETAQVSMF